MTWVRYYSKKIFGPYLGHLSPESAQKYLNIARVAYFFSAGSLFLMLLDIKKKNQDELLESGKPVIEDLSPAHKELRLRDADVGLIRDFSTPGKVETIVYNKEEYYSVLERNALEKAKEAQLKALSEGRELPPDAIKLV